MFESINSKGKKLEDIDLFKSYIFSQLDASDCESYLNVWGQLIIETEDHLYDYIYNFIKAYISFYRQNINVKNFKSICQDELISYYQTDNTCEALKKFLMDLKNKVKYYKMFLHPGEAYSFVNNNKFKFYFLVFNNIGYKHPIPLFMRALEEYGNGKLSKDDLVNVIVETTTFMLEFQTIGEKASRDVITLFSQIMNSIYDNGQIVLEQIEGAFAKEFSRRSITVDNFKDNVAKMDAYTQNKALTNVLLALYESTISNNGKVSYDQASNLLEQAGVHFSLDHLLPQTPDKNSSNFKYYEDETSHTVVLKEGSDFPETIQSGITDYDTFKSMILNKIGNLRICYKDKNSSRGNDPISLPEYPDFYSYQDIEKRNQNIVNVLFDEIFPFPNVNIENKKNDLSNDGSGLPSMDELIRLGLVNIGDELYIKGYPETSKAVLLDSKNVNFQGQKMGLNQWGCKVKKWDNIDIYHYAIRVEDNETLQEKRIKLANQDND